MKIAQVVCVIPPYNGGLGTVAEQFSNELVDLGHDVTIFIPDSPKIAQVEKKYTIKRVKPIFSLGLGFLIPQLLWKIRGFDVIHLHFPFFGGSFQTSLAKLFNKKSKFIVTYHQDLKLKSWMDWYYKISLKICWPVVFKLVDKVHVASFDYLLGSLVKKDYKNYPEKFVEIPFGADDRFFPTLKDQDLLKKHNLTNEDKIVLFVGGIDSVHYFKGIEVLIESFSKIKESRIKALVVGKGNLLESYKQKAEKLNLQDRIVFAGYVDNENLAKYYNLSDIAVLPSINSNEAFGLVLAEAMACGKPVIASDLRGVRTVLRNYENGYLVRPGDSDDLVAKIEKIFSSKDLYFRFSQKSLEIAKEKYNWHQIVKKLEEVYKNT